MNEFKSRVIELFEASEERLDRLEEQAAANPEDSSYRLEVIVETARNVVLRELLGKDNRDDELNQ